jgi:hypothetical protein
VLAPRREISKRFDCLLETCQRRPTKAGSNLTDTRLSVRDAGIEDWCDSGFCNTLRVDTESRAAESEYRDREARMLAKRYLVPVAPTN